MVHDSTTIVEILAELESRLGAGAVANVTLQRGGRVLELSRTLTYYGIGRDNTINLVSRLRAGMHQYVCLIFAGLVILQEASRRRAVWRAAAAETAATAAEAARRDAANTCELGVMVSSPSVAPLPDTLCEALYSSLQLPASIQRGGSGDDLRRLLARRRTRRFLFTGHGERSTVILLAQDGAIAPPPPGAITSLLGRHTPRHGGLLELVFLNCCFSERLAMRLLLAGVSHVVCWRTLACSNAAHLVSRVFFDEVGRGASYEDAFVEAVDALVLKERPRLPHDAAATVRSPRFEIRDPLEPGGPPSHKYPRAAGIPLLLCPRDRPNVRRALLRAAMAPRIALHAWLRRARARARAGAMRAK